jgi:hypothetical protein
MFISVRARLLPHSSRRRDSDADFRRGALRRPADLGGDKRHYGDANAKLPMSFDRFFILLLSIQAGEVMQGIWRMRSALCCCMARAVQYRVRE